MAEFGAEPDGTSIPLRNGSAHALRGFVLITGHAQSGESSALVFNTSAIAAGAAPPRVTVRTRLDSPVAVAAVATNSADGDMLLVCDAQGKPALLKPALYFHHAFVNKMLMAKICLFGVIAVLLGTNLWILRQKQQENEAKQKQS